MTRSLLLLIFLIQFIPAFSRETYPIEIRRVKVNLKEGQLIGNDDKTKPGEPIVLTNQMIGDDYYDRNFRSKNDFYENEIIENIEAGLLALGMKVDGYGNVFVELREYEAPRYAIAIFITDLKFTAKRNKDMAARVSGISKFHSHMEIQIQMLDLISDKIVLDKKIKSEFYDENTPGYDHDLGNYKNYLEDVFKKLARDISLDPEFNELITVREKDAVSSDPGTPIDVNNNNESMSIQEVIGSTVTIQMGSGHGSGVIISSDGLILTCQHVVYSTEEVEVVFANGVKTKAKIIRKSPEFDLALLQLNDMQSNGVPFFKGDITEPGTEAWAVGTPGYRNLGQSVTRGIVSATRQFDDKTYLQTDASVSPGNSGGPLVNSEGQLLGIVNAKIVRDDMEGVGFAIPVKVALEKLNLK